MKYSYVLILLFLCGCSSALKTNEDNLAPVFRALSKKDFKNANALLSKTKAYKKHGRRQIYYRDGENVYMVEEIFLRNKIGKLNEAFRECIKLSNSLNSSDNYDYFTRNCLKTSESSRSPLKLSVNALKKYSRESLAGLFFDNNSKYLAVKKEKEKKNFDAHQKALQMDKAIKADAKKLKELSKKPTYKKCKLQSDLVDSKKMLKIWNKNIDDLKNDAKRAGQMTHKMEKDMDKSLSFVRTYKAKIVNINRQLKKFSNVRVSESSCKEIVPDYGKSNADQYM